MRTARLLTVSPSITFPQRHLRTIKVSIQLESWILNKHLTVWFTSDICVCVNVNIRFKIQGSINNCDSLGVKFCVNFPVHVVAKKWVPDSLLNFSVQVKVDEITSVNAPT